MADVKYTMWLSLIAQPGSKSVCRLIEAFDGDTEAIYRATEEDYRAVKGVNTALVKALGNKDMKKALSVLHFCQKRRIGILPFDDPAYPKRLRRLYDFPILLYYRGKFPDIDNEVAIATVGTRSLTEYGQQNGYVISRDLARAGAIVVSGMASGVDAVCHRGALDALGHTIAVLGCGIDVVYPKQHDDLMEEIARTGTVITEYAPGTPPAGYNFPKRNRIISGLSLGTLVVEADDRSGALITANYAKEQGRDIFAMPGNVGEMNSLGTNSLIKQGARMVTSALDILSEYELLFVQKIHTEKLRTSVTKMYVEPVKTFKRNAFTPIVDDRDNVDEHGVSYASGKFKNLFSPKKKARAKEEPQTQTKTQTPTQAKESPALPKPGAIPSHLTQDEVSVLNAMPNDRGVTTDEIARTGIPVAKVLVALTTLEIKKLVVPLPGGNYMKNL